MSIQTDNSLFSQVLSSQNRPTYSPSIPPNPGSMFSQILRKMTADASQSHDVPLDKEMIQQMIQWLNIKMNERLIQSVSTDGLNSPQKENWELFLSRYAAGMESNKKEEQISPAVVEPERKRYSSFASIERFVQKAAAAHDVDPGLIRSVIQVESNFDASARSPKGAMGLMQLMPGTAKELGVNDPYDPEENIMGGTRYLKKLLNRYNGDVSLALAAYNWGMGNLESRPARMPEETKNYIKQVTKLYGMDNKEIL